MDDIRSHWSQALSGLPQAVWLQRYGTISTPAPFTSREAKALFNAFDNLDPPTRRQKAITPRLLRKLLEASVDPSLRDTAPAVAADIIIGGFFFTMCSCEYSKPPTVGRTRCVDLDGVLFRTTSNALIDHDDPALLTLAEFVTVMFVNQKNGQKMDSRTQRRTRDSQLCPVIRYATQVQRILRMLPTCWALPPSTRSQSTGKLAYSPTRIFSTSCAVPAIGFLWRKSDFRIRPPRDK
jgi:hypothetical protein